MRRIKAESNGLQTLIIPHTILKPFCSTNVIIHLSFCFLTNASMYILLKEKFYSFVGPEIL